MSWLETRTSYLGVTGAEVRPKRLPSAAPCPGASNVVTENPRSTGGATNPLIWLPRPDQPWASRMGGPFPHV